MAILERDKIQRQIATLGMEVPSDSVEDYVGEHGGDGTGPGGTSDYEKLKNKPQINGVELIGDLSAVELGLAALTDIPESQDLSIFRPSADEDIINNELQRQITENESAILTEAQRAGQAEGALQTAIQNEAQRAAQAEGILQGKISQNAVGIAATDAKLPRQYEEYTGIGFQAPDVATALYATQGQRVKGLRIWIINEEKWYVFENGIADSDFVIEGKTGGYFQTNIGFTVHSAIDQILADVTWFYTGAGIEQMFSNPMPMADESQPGFQSKENVLALKKAIADIASLQQGMTSEDTGIRAATYADLMLVISDPLWNTGDWALVTADENNNGATVRYTWNADTQSWEFDRIMSLSAIEVATDLAAGIVLSTPQLTGGIKNYGRILVEQTGVMSLIGWDDVWSVANNAFNGLSGKQAASTGGAGQLFFANHSGGWTSVSPARIAALDSGITDLHVSKLDGIEPAAQANVIETVKVNGAALTPDIAKAVDVIVPKIPASTEGYFATHSGTEGQFGAPISPALVMQNVSGTIVNAGQYIRISCPKEDMRCVISLYTQRGAALEFGIRGVNSETNIINILYATMDVSGITCRKTGLNLFLYIPPIGTTNNNWEAGSISWSSNKPTLFVSSKMEYDGADTDVTIAVNDMRLVNYPFRPLSYTTTRFVQFSNFQNTRGMLLKCYGGADETISTSHSWFELNFPNNIHGDKIRLYAGNNKPDVYWDGGSLLNGFVIDCKDAIYRSWLLTNGLYTGQFTNLSTVIANMPNGMADMPTGYVLGTVLDRRTATSG